MKIVQLTMMMWLFVMGTAVAQTETITLEPARDATIYEQGNNNPDGGEVANAGGLYLLTGKTQRYGVRRPLLYFDVAEALPPDAVVTNAILSLTLQQWMTDGNGNEFNINRQMFAHRVQSDWGVGTSGDGTTSLGGGGFDATAGDVTWTDRFFGSESGEQWATEGGDFAAEPSGNGLIWPRIEGRSFSWGDPEMADDVNAWLANPAENYGWIMITNEEDPQSILRFYASEWTEVEARPQLILTYESGAEVATAVSVSTQQTGSADVLSVVVFVVVLVAISTISHIERRKTRQRHVSTEKFVRQEDNPIIFTAISAGVRPVVSITVPNLSRTAGAF